MHRLGNRRFLIWLAVMVPLVVGLTILGLNCPACQLPVEAFR
jgi:hypothetical protein